MQENVERDLAKNRDIYSRREVVWERNNLLNSPISLRNYDTWVSFDLMAFILHVYFQRRKPAKHLESGTIIFSMLAISIWMSLHCSSEVMKGIFSPFGFLGCIPLVTLNLTKLYWNTSQENRVASEGLVLMTLISIQYKNCSLLRI